MSFVRKGVYRKGDTETQENYPSEKKKKTEQSARPEAKNVIFG